eukprot:1396117-Alexandrium_andersonii.AAC.1
MSSARREMFGGSGVSSKRPESRSVLKGPCSCLRRCPKSRTSSTMVHWRLPTNLKRNEMQASNVSPCLRPWGSGCCAKGMPR